MQHDWRFACLWILLLLVSPSLPAARGATPALDVQIQAFGTDGATNGTWVMLRIQAVLPADTLSAVISVQDMRGGIRVARALLGEGAGTTRRTWVSLPLIRPGDLVGGKWPLEAIVHTWDGRELGRRQIDVELGNTATAAERLLRVVVPEGAQSAAQVIDWHKISTAPAVFMELSEEELLSGPPLIFAGVDAVFVPAALQQRLTRAQVLAIAAAGTRVVLAGEGPPAGATSELGGLVWECVDPAPAASAWLFPALPIDHPAVIETGLSPLVEWSKPARPDAVVRLSAILVGPIALVVVLIVRGLFRGFRTAVAAAAVSLAALTAGTAVYLHTAAPHLERSAKWRQTLAPQTPGEAAGAVAVDEVITAFSPLFAENWQTTPESHAVLWPVAATVPSYWALRDLQLTCAPHEADTQANAAMISCRLEGRLPARSNVTYAERRLTATGLLPSFPTRSEERARFARLAEIDPASGWWIIDGYAYPGDAESFTGSSGNAILLTELADKSVPASPALRESLKAWYELRFLAPHRYFLRLAASPPAPALQFIDFGPASTEH